MSLRSFSSGSSPASELLVALTMTMNRIFLSPFGFDFRAGLPGDIDRLDPGFTETTNEGPLDQQDLYLFSREIRQLSENLDFFEPSARRLPKPSIRRTGAFPGSFRQDPAVTPGGRLRMPDLIPRVPRDENPDATLPDADPADPAGLARGRRRPRVCPAPRRGARATPGPDS